MSPTSSQDSAPVPPQALRPTLSVLLLEDSALDAELLQARLEEGDWQCTVHRVETREAFAAALARGGCDVILADFSLPAFDGLSALSLAQAALPDVPFLFVSGAIGEELAIEMLKRGATDYVLKDRLERLVPSVRRALREAEAREERRRAQQALQFLLEASGALAGTLGFDNLLQTIARLTVPQLADWCMLHLLQEDGTAVRKVAAHAQPARQVVLERLRQAMAGNAPDAHPIATVLRTGRLVVHAQADAAQLAQLSGLDGETLGAFVELGCDSLLSVPLMSRERLLGALTLVRSGSGRGYRQADCILAEEFARRAALALDSAQLYQRAQDAVRQREELLAIVSHDLRNPLGAVVMSASLLGRKLLVEEGRTQERRHVETIQRSAQRMKSLIQDLMDLASVQTGRLSVQPVPRELGTLLTEAMELLEPLTVEKCLTLSSTVEGARCQVRCDPNRVLQVLSNLVGNAIKFTPEGGRITLTARVVGTEACLTVRDTGPGIPPEHLGHLFDRYWQAERKPQKGIGLGLSIAKGIIEAHGGRIWAESPAEGGALFSFTLPLAGPLEGPP